MEKINEFLNNNNLTTLKRSYMDACSNEDFSSFISTIDASDEVLMKYTSTLEEAMCEYINCKNCKNILTCKNKVEGFCYKPEVVDNTLQFSYVMCKKKRDLEDAQSYLKNIKYYEMSKDIVNASFKDLYKDDTTRTPILKYMMKFMKDYNSGKKNKGLYLTGSFGSGKTYLVAALLNELSKKGVKCVVVYYPEFLRDIKASFKTDYDEKFNSVKKAELLLIDDIGAEAVTNYSRDEILSPILQFRMEEHLPTFFTSNLTLDELENHLSITSSGVDKVKARRILERVKQLSMPMELVSKNRRD